MSKALGSRILLTAEDVEQAKVPLSDGERDACLSVLKWARAYLCRPHLELGRKGAVCPFVAGALARRSFYLVIGPSTVETPTDIEEIGIEMGGVFPTLEPVSPGEAQYKTILVLFPEMPDEQLPVLDEAQRRLKPSFVERGYMVGQFHRRPPKNPGLWNPAFRPLNSDVPMLVIRHMVSSDLPFLLDDAAFVRSWFRYFGKESVPGQRDQLRRSVEPDLLREFEQIWDD